MRCAAVVLAASVAAFVGTATHAAKRDPDTLPVTRVLDLHYGDVLFHFFQDENFEALTRLKAYESWGRLPSHLAEARLLEGGMYLSLGLHNQAGERFERLLTQDIPPGVRNRAWFYLGKVWYARGYLDRAERALTSVTGELSPELESDRLVLFANVLIRQGRFDDAVRLLEAFQGSPEWAAYARFNLGVALVRRGDLAGADRALTAVGTLETRRPELLALRDKANLALGFAYLQAEQPAPAKLALERVRLAGPSSNKALLGVGWANASLGAYREALAPWLELHDRNLLDAAVQESYLAVPYAFAKLGANAQAAEYYERAISSFDAETSSIDGSIQRIRDGRLLDAMLESEQSGNYGWFWQLRQLPDAPESRYLYALLAGHDFQEGLKNYRDLAFMRGTLARWSSSMEAFDDMIDARQRAFDERIPRTDALLASEVREALSGSRDALDERLATIEREGNAAALGSAAERAQWARILAVESAIVQGTSGLEGDELALAKEKLRLVKGVLSWRLQEAFRARLYQERRALRDLDAALREAERRWVRVERARGSVTENTGEFAARVHSLGARLAATQGRLEAARDRQNDFLEQRAVDELNAQKDRLAAYRVQARFALASIYDRAANPPATSGTGASAPPTDASPGADPGGTP
jgi:hypothetical protein